MRRTPDKIFRMLASLMKRRAYDLPLNRNASALFITFLIGLMSFLALLALSASFAMGGMRERWSSGLENNLTVEIAAETPDGTLRSREEIAAIAEKAGKIISSDPATAEVRILDEQEMTALVEPWIGNNISAVAGIPFPGMIAVTLKSRDDFSFEAMETRLQTIDPGIRLDAHEDWLKDLLRFTGALRFASILLALTVGVTAAIAVAGAVNSLMAVHADQVGILHLMGATNSYITRQFQRHVFTLALQGGIAGTITGGLTVTLIGWSSGNAGINLLPDFSLTFVQFFIVACIPLMAGILAVLTAGRTVRYILDTLP